MRTPIRSTPEPVERWMARVRLLRWLDALAGWLALWFALVGWLGELPAQPAALVALAIVGVLALIGPVRRSWRPISAAVGLWMSRSIAVGDRAWRVGPSSADQVIVTAHRGVRVTVAGMGNDAAEGVSVRRTRVLILPL